MITIREYKKVQSLEEAYELNQKKSNRIIGGMIWLKMETLNVGTAIDLSDLGLDAVEETETEFRIGAMTTLRTLETHEGLAAYTNGAMRESVRHIVGVQLRNLATLGGSLYSRFGFSDVLTMFLALDASVELYKGGIIFYSLGNFLFENDTTTHQPADFYEKYHMSNTSMVGEGMDNRSKNGTIGLGVNPDVWRSVIAQWDVEGGKATALRLYPIHLGMELPRYRRGLPAFAEDDELLTHLAELSAPFGTRIDIVDHVGIVRL